MMRLAQCTDSDYLRELAAIEQTLSVEKSILHSPLLVVESNKVMVIKQIIRVVEFFLQVTGQKMEKFQIHVLAGDLRDAFSTDTLDDVILMFKMARKGEFGKVYGKLDHFTIMEWVPQYMAQKSLVREQLIQRQKNIVCTATGCDEAAASQALHQADGEAKTAIIMLMLGLDAEKARALLATHQGVTSAAIDAASSPSSQGV